MTRIETGSKLKREQLRAHLMAELRSGRIPPGEALPSELEVARQLNVSRNTVRQALGELEQAGLVQRIRGKGTFATGKSSDDRGQRAASFALVALDVCSGYYRQLFAEFERSANQVGHSAVVCNSNNDLDRQGNHILALLDQKVAGVVLNPCATSVTPAHHVRILQEAGVPVVLLHRAVPGVSAPVLEIPGFEIGRCASEAAAALGHRRVAFLDSQRTTIGEQCALGLRETITEMGGELPEELIDYGHMTGTDRRDYAAYEEYLAPVIERLMSRPDPPTALFMGNRSHPM